MNRTLFLVLVTLAVAVMPNPAHGGGHGHHHGHHHGHRFHHFVGFFVVPYPFDPSLCYPYPCYGYPYPYVVYSPPVVVEQPPAVYQPPAVQREVVYPNGKYVLYGDGVNQPYQWVWFPAAPPAPPPAEPPQ